PAWLTLQLPRLACLVAIAVRSQPRVLGSIPRADHATRWKSTSARGCRVREASKPMPLLAPGPRALCRDLYCAAAAREQAVPSSVTACSTVGGARALGLRRGGVGGGARTGRGGVRAEAAYFWDASVPVEMGEIDSMDKLDAALASSAEQNQPIIIDWYGTRTTPAHMHPGRLAYHCSLISITALLLCFY
uniref:Uncharacterized protein n=2 Tax=Aegilops tauschii subsp. strangulata TaxID=200361 RepID=A0A453PP90_AEGTS